MVRRPGRALSLVLATVVASLLAACGGGGGSGTTSTSGAGASSTVETAPTTAPPPSGPRSAPRWETVTSFKGTGATTSAPFDILPGAIQWRARWSCQTGSLEVTTDPPPRKPRPLVSGACPGQGEGFAIHTGSIRLGVVTSGPWEVTVDQQIDTALDEPPLPGMDADHLIGEGSFSPIEMRGTGTARLYRLPDGRAAVRLENFETSSNTDLFVWLSEADDPRTSADAVAADRVEIGNLKSTLGSQNYVVPSDLPVEKVRSIVIWCQPVSIAYTAAPLPR